MFGLLGLLFGGAVVAGENISTEMRKEDSRQKSIRNGDDCYYDCKGGKYYVETGKRCISSVVNGDYCLVESKTGRVLKNYSEEERQKEKIKRKQFALDFARKMGYKYYHLTDDNNVTTYYELNTDREIVFRTKDIGVLDVDKYEGYATKRKLVLNCLVYIRYKDQDESEEKLLTAEEANKYYKGSWDWQ